MTKYRSALGGPAGVVPVFLAAHDTPPPNVALCVALWAE